MLAFIAMQSSLFSILQKRNTKYRQRAKSTSLSSEAVERQHVDRAQRREGFLHLCARRAIDNQARYLRCFRKSRSKLSRERVNVGCCCGGVLKTFIKMADLSIIADCPLVIQC